MTHWSKFIPHPVTTVVPVDSPNPFYKVDRPYRRAKREQLNRRGIKPTQLRWMVCVETTAIEIPAWAKAKREKRLALAPHRVWFKGRTSGLPRILERQDRESGGSPILTMVEYRVCGRCGRILLNLEAAQRRKDEESSPQGRELPCGSECK